MATILPVPESEKRVLENLLRDLNETYPDKQIIRLQQDHKKWYEKVSRLYKNIGYENRDDFLAAYGFTEIKGKGGRPTDDLSSIMNELIKRYEGDKCVSSVDQLKEENPDLAPKFKNIQNKSQELFGMSFNKYLKEKGVIRSDAAKEAVRKDEISKKLDVIIDELKKRYDGKELPFTVKELKDNNSDIENIQNIVPMVKEAYDTNSADYLRDLGLLQEDKTALYEIKLNDAVAELKKRYEGKAAPQNISTLINENRDLGIYRIENWIQSVHNKPAQDYLIEVGLMVVAEGTVLKDSGFKRLSTEEQVEFLRCKYDGKLQKPTNVQDLMADNLELPIKSFYKKIQEEKGDAYLYLWDEGILTPFKFRNGMTRLSVPPMNEGQGITSLEVPKGTVGILKNSFHDCNGVTELIIPDTVKYIGSSAFDCYGLKSLKEIRFGKGVKETGEELFGAGLESLEGIYLNDGVENINGRLFNEWAFSSSLSGRGLARLRVIEVPGKLKGFAGNIFSGIPSSVEIRCSQEIKEALKNNSKSPENDYYIWDENKTEYVQVDRNPFSEEDIINKYGIPNDDMLENIKFYDDVNNMIIEDRSFCFSGIPSHKQEEYEYSVRQAGGKVQKEINGKTDYLVINKKAATDRMKYNGVRYRLAAGKLKIINLNTFEDLFKSAGGKLNTEEILVANKDTVDAAISLYNSIVSKLQNAGADFRAILEAFQATEYVYVSPKKFEETVLVKQFCADLGLESKDIIHGSPMVGGVGIEYPVAMVVANTIICGKESAGEMVFSRDKWEYRNDYSSATRPAFKWSTNVNDWKVYRKPGYKRFSNM